MMNIPFRILLSILATVIIVNVHAQVAWPKEIPFKNGGKATIYQPQPESFEGNKLIGRSAIAVKETAKSDPVYGVAFYTAYMSTDKVNRTALLDSITITNAKFSDVDNQAKIDQLVDFLEAEVPKWNLEISLDALVATIQREYPNAEIYNNDPPKILYKTKPTSLVVLNGEPIIQKDKDLDADRVVNSPNLIFKEGTQWNMYNGGVWYKSNAVTTGWSPLTTMSEKVKSINEQIKKQEKENNDGNETTETPEVTDIVIATEPTEVIQSKGAAVYTNIEGTNLSYVSNSSDNILKDNSTQSIYILLAGRWYKSSSLQGPWTFNEPDKLPADFSNIPEGSEKDGVLASVAGTDAANEAMIDAEIPQTAKVDRKTATVKVEYDGAPKFSPIEGTSLQLAENSNLTVFKESAGKYFALDNGVWFTGSSEKGPWSVATERPKDVEKIPMQSAAYNAKFVHIYEVTPTYTVQGYTAGYLGSYIQGDPVIVYGTGFYYRPWYGAVYYPRPVTWGFGFTYNPWTGWSMSYSYNVGFMHIGFYFGPSYGYGYGGGWFGPPMYRPPYYRPPYGGGGYYGHHGGGNHYGNNNININNNITINNNRNNLYNNKPGVTTRNKPMDSSVSSKTKNYNKPGANNTTSPRPGTSGTGRPTAQPGKGDNNVYADKQGNVYQRDKQGNINQRDNTSGSWKPTGNKEVPPSTRPASKPATQPSAKPSTPTSRPSTQPTTRPSTQPTTRPATPTSRPAQAPPGSLNRDMQMRDNGAARTNNYQSQSRPAPSRPSGGSTRPSSGGMRRG